MILYYKTSSLHRIDEARKELFARRGRLWRDYHQLKANELHTRLEFGDYEQSKQHAPKPDGWGWTPDEESQSWVPVWNTLPLASKACTELVKCGCKSEKGCGARCGCKKEKWPCTELCSCNCLTTNSGDSQ